MQTSKGPCYLLCKSKSPATIIGPDPHDGGYYWVRDCECCVRYRISKEFIRTIEENSPVLNVRSRLPLLSAAAQRVARDVDAGKEPPEELAAHVVMSEGGKRWLQITDDQAAAEIAANEEFLQKRG